MLNTARVVYRFCAKSSVCSKLKRVIDRQSGRQTDTVRCRLDYCNSALAGVAKVYLQKLQSVQNMAARMVSGVRRSENIAQVLEDLH